jgi:hypothetical protein
MTRLCADAESRPVRILVIGALVELALIVVHAWLARALDGSALAASMLGGQIGLGLMAGLLLVLVRLGAIVFVPMSVVGLAVRAALLRGGSARHPRSRTERAGAPSPS